MYVFTENFILGMKPPELNWKRVETSGNPLSVALEITITIVHWSLRLMCTSIQLFHGYVGNSQIIVPR